mmetsp:Transcript_40668/g.97515  ORF Transcript_40668/g.97515 Transcript_40668/m.97515 type:complete len:205 (+) Transcript_40668:598-1212(+)
MSLFSKTPAAPSRMRIPRSPDPAMIFRRTVGAVPMPLTPRPAYNPPRMLFSSITGLHPEKQEIPFPRPAATKFLLITGSAGSPTTAMHVLFSELTMLPSRVTTPGELISTAVYAAWRWRIFRRRTVLPLALPTNLRAMQFCGARIAASSPIPSISTLCLITTASSSRPRTRIRCGRTARASASVGNDGDGTTGAGSMNASTASV